MSSDCQTLIAWLERLLNHTSEKGREDAMEKLCLKLGYPVPMDNPQARNLLKKLMDERAPECLIGGEDEWSSPELAGGGTTTQIIGRFYVGGEDEWSSPELAGGGTTSQIIGRFYVSLIDETEFSSKTTSQTFTAPSQNAGAPPPVASSTPPTLAAPLIPHQHQHLRDKGPANSPGYPLWDGKGSAAVTPSSPFDAAVIPGCCSNNTSVTSYSLASGFGFGKHHGPKRVKGVCFGHIEIILIEQTTVSSVDHYKVFGEEIKRSVQLIPELERLDPLEHTVPKYEPALELELRRVLKAGTRKTLNKLVNQLLPYKTEYGTLTEQDWKIRIQKMAQEKWSLLTQQGNQFFIDRVENAATPIAV